MTFLGDWTQSSWKCFFCTKEYTMSHHLQKCRSQQIRTRNCSVQLFARTLQLQSFQRQIHEETPNSQRTPPLPGKNIFCVLGAPPTTQIQEIISQLHRHRRGSYAPHGVLKTFARACLFYSTTEVYGECTHVQ